MRARNVFLAILLAVGIAASPGAGALQFDTMFVFGDSLSDGGNVFVRTGGFPPPPYNRRFTDGITAVEHLAQQRGLTLTPSELGGTNYAYGGATTGSDNFLAFSTPPLSPVLVGTGMREQITAFGSSGAVFDAERTLFTVWGGPNDFFLAAGLGTPIDGAFIGAVVGNLIEALARLDALGARHILVPNLPNLGAIPANNGIPADAAAAQLASIAFNMALAGALDAFDATHASRIVQFDTFSLLNAVVATPADFGFTDATRACLAVPAECFAPGASFLFWDTAHPTGLGHQVLARQFDAAIPEPRIALLLAAGLLMMMAARRRTVAPAL